MAVHSVSGKFVSIQKKRQTRSVLLLYILYYYILYYYYILANLSLRDHLKMTSNKLKHFWHVINVHPSLHDVICKISFSVLNCNLGSYTTRVFFQVLAEKQSSLKSQMKKGLSNIVSLKNRATAGASSAAAKQVNLTGVQSSRLFTSKNHSANIKIFIL